MDHYLLSSSRRDVFLSICLSADLPVCLIFCNFWRSVFQSVCLLVYRRKRESLSNQSDALFRVSFSRAVLLVAVVAADLAVAAAGQMTTKWA